jgi:hypothetical protein
MLYLSCRGRARIGSEREGRHEVLAPQQGQRVLPALTHADRRFQRMQHPLSTSPSESKKQ